MFSIISILPIKIHNKLNRLELGNFSCLYKTNNRIRVHRDIWKYIFFYPEALQNREHPIEQSGKSSLLTESFEENAGSLYV